MIIEHLSKIDSTNEYIKKYIKKRKDLSQGNIHKGNTFVQKRILRRRRQRI